MVLLWDYKVKIDVITSSEVGLFEYRCSDRTIRSNRNSAHSVLRTSSLNCFNELQTSSVEDYYYFNYVTIIIEGHHANHYSCLCELFFEGIIGKNLGIIGKL